MFQKIIEWSWPWLQVSDVGTLLTDAGFKLVTVDTDIVHVNFCNAAHAMETLQVLAYETGIRFRSTQFRKHHAGDKFAGRQNGLFVFFFGQ